METFLTVLAIVSAIILLSFINWFAPIERIVDQGDQHFDNCQFSPRELFSEIEIHLSKKNLPDVSIQRITLKESGFFSHKREYLRIDKDGLAFDIGCYLYGGGVFVSWRLGFLKESTANDTSYYEHDKTKAFKLIVKRAFNNSLNHLTSDQVSSFPNN